MARHKVRAVINEDLTRERPNSDELYNINLLALAFNVYGMFGYNSVMRTYYPNDIIINDIIRGAVAIGFLIGFIPLRMISNTFANDKIKTLVRKS